jgi:lysophospholipase L1-like esterase
MKIKRVEILLTLFSTIIAVILGLLLIRWLQPSLLGMPSDMVLVSSSEKVVPYYENIFRKQDILSNEFILKDPLVRVRARQLYPDMNAIGPNDILGFRNAAVPNNADVIIIGDSQTYGNNAHMVENWPHYFAGLLPNGVSVYSMATGGWGAVQYYYAALKAPAFSPKVIIVAFYTGNDPLETYSMVYGSDVWNEFISESSLNKNDVPPIESSLTENKQWAVTFSDGVKTVFTPALRHSTNKQHPVIDAAYQSMIKVANKISTHAVEDNIHVIFTLIPTKEYVYAKKIEYERIEMNSAYKVLIRDEKTRIQEFSNALTSIDNTSYIDVINDLQEAALGKDALYPPDSNGHPVAKGYKVIGETIARGMSDILQPAAANGLAVVLTADESIKILVFIENKQYWFVDVPDDLITSTKIEVNQVIKKRDLTGFLYSGHKNIQEVVRVK